MDHYSLFSLTLALFFLMDSIGNVPMYIAILKDFDPPKQRKIIIRELIIALIVIVLFTFIGDSLLDVLSVGPATISISGGIILFIIAIRMIFPKGKDTSFEPQGEPFIVPLAIPLVAGPAVLAAVMIYSHKEPITTLLLAICIAWALSTVILILAPFLKKILGVRGITAMERLMGLILTLMAVQMFLNGLSLYLEKQ